MVGSIREIGEIAIPYPLYGQPFEGGLLIDAPGGDDRRVDRYYGATPAWTSPISTDSGRWLKMLLKLHGRFVAQRRVGALPIVKDFDVFQDRLPRLGARIEIVMMDQLRFQGGSELLPN